MSTETKAALAPEQKAPIIEYTLADDGTINRTDENDTIRVGTLNNGILALNPEWAKFRAPVVRYLNELGKAPKSVVMEGDEEAAVKRAKEKIPPMPKKSLRLGDKTPAVVEHLRKYKPEEWRANYGIRGEGLVTKTRKVIDPKTGQLVTEEYQVVALIADRKTHLTEKVEANEDADSDYDDSLDTPRE